MLSNNAGLTCRIEWRLKKRENFSLIVALITFMSSLFVFDIYMEYCMRKKCCFRPLNRVANST